MATATNNRAVCIVGYGARTPLGLNALSSAATVRAAISGFGEHPYMIDKAGNPMVVAMDASLSVDLMGLDRFVEFGMSAATEALSPLYSAQSRTSSIHMLVGLPAIRPGLPKNFSKKMTQALSEKFKDIVCSIVGLQAGHSAGLIVLEKGCRRIIDRTAEFCLIGGIESYHEPETLEWLDEHDQLNSETNSFGFIPGEAAGFCLICSQETARRYGLKTVGMVLSVGTELETKLIKTNSVCLGEGLSKVVKRVVQDLASGTKVNYMICDLNGEPYRGDEFGYTLVRVSEHFFDPTDFLTPADCWGDVGPASGPLFIMLSLVSILKGYSRGPLTLVWTSSESGERSAALIQAT